MDDEADTGQHPTEPDSTQADGPADSQTPEGETPPVRRPPSSEEESSVVDDRATAEGDALSSDSEKPSPRVPENVEEITVEKSTAQVTPVAPPVTEVVEISDDVIDDDDAGDVPIADDNGDPRPLTFLERLDAGMERAFPTDD